jgi:glutathionylspermidine synthase
MVKDKYADEGELIQNLSTLRKMTDRYYFPNIHDPNFTLNICEIIM